MGDEFDQYKVAGGTAVAAHPADHPADDEFAQYKQSARPDFSQNPPSGVTKPHIKMEMMGDVLPPEKGPHSVGVSEGQGLREGLAEYDRQGFGKIGEGAADVAHGEIARGGHKIITGAGAAASPAIAMTIPAMAAAPVTTAATVGTGYLAGKGLRGVTEHFGGTPDQADVAEDIGNLGGGYAGSKVVPLVSRLTPKLVAQGVGGVTGGIAGHGTLSAPGAYYGGRAGGRIAEGLLGEERANTNFRGETPAQRETSNFEKGVASRRAALAKDSSDIPRPQAAPPAEAPSIPAPRPQGPPPPLHPDIQSRIDTAERGEFQRPQSIREQQITRAGNDAAARRATLEAESPTIPPSARAAEPSLEDLWNQHQPKPSAIPPPRPPMPPELQSRIDATLRDEPPPPRIPEPEVPRAAAPSIPQSNRELSQTLDRQLRAGLGVKDTIPAPPVNTFVRPGIPMKAQMEPPTGSVAEGHTSVESSALKSWKYDPATRVFSAETKNGAIYRHAEVTPEEAKAFADADSKGTAWKDIRDNHALIKKNFHGDDVATAKSHDRIVTPQSQPRKGEFDMGAFSTTRGGQLRGVTSQAAKQDLTGDLEKSLAHVQRNRVDRIPTPSTLSKGLTDAEQTIPARIPEARPGDSGQGQAVPEPRQPSTQPVSGAATKIRVPGENKSYPATYQVRELEDVQPSHSGLTFQHNEKYGLTNDRDYTNPLNQGKVATNATAEKFDPTYHITDNPDATNGPPIINADDGEVLGGNGRTMILQRVYAQNPQGAAAYKTMLAEKAQAFGLDPAAIAKMKQPVLVREVADADLAGNSGKQEAITDFNKVGTAAMTPGERAIADSRRVSQDTLDSIAAKIEGQGNEGTLADALQGRSGGEILDKLIQDGVLTQQDRAAFADENGLTQAGRERIGKLVTGRFFRDPAQLDATPPAIRAKLEAIAAPLARIDGIEGWDLTPKLHEALDLLEEARQHGLNNLDDVVQQKGLFGESTKYSPDGIALAKAIKTMPVRALTKTLRLYAQDAANANSNLLFGPSATPQQAFHEAFP